MLTAKAGLEMSVLQDPRNLHKKPAVVVHICRPRVLTEMRIWRPENHSEALRLASLKQGPKRPYLNLGEDEKKRSRGMLPSPTGIVHTQTHIQILKKECIYMAGCD